MGDIEGRAGLDEDAEMQDVQDAPNEPNDNHIFTPDPPPTHSATSNEHKKKASRWVELYPGSAGATKGTGQSNFDKIREQQREAGEDLWAPFKSQDEWELAKWLLHNVGHNATNEFLKLPIVSTYSQIYEYNIH